MISGIGVRPVFIFIAKVRGKGLQKFTPVGQFSFLLRFGESPSHQTLHFGRLGGEVSAPRSRSCHSGRLEVLWRAKEKCFYRTAFDGKCG